ncbi:MAG: EF-hand domain-containing protein [Magnetococcus sp. YQC-3]
MKTTQILLALGSLVWLLPAEGMAHPSWAGGHGMGRCCTEQAAFNASTPMTREEFSKLRLSHFAAADRNQDGYLTEEELSGLPSHGALPWHGRMMARLDTNHDGRIAKEEFVAFTPPRLAVAEGGMGSLPACAGRGRGAGWRYGMCGQ